MESAGASAVNLIPVRMGEMAMSSEKRDVLSVVGLGSCVALILIAPKKGAAALAHVVLPERKMTSARQVPPGKFADTALPALLEAFAKFRIKPTDLYAILVGGATMFGHTKGSKLAGIGDRNIAAVHEVLALNGIGVASEDVGGTSGRSVQVAVDGLEVFVRSGAGEPFAMSGSTTPLVVKIPETPSDAVAEPFPEDIWATDSEQDQIAS